jgi:hypothetical protein
VAIECDLTVSIDDIGRCTRRMWLRAIAAATSNGVNEEPEDDSDDDGGDIGKEIN